jgi:hypothetical protein
MSDKDGLIMSRYRRVRTACFISNPISKVFSQCFHNIGMQMLRRQIAQYKWGKPRCDLAIEYMVVLSKGVGIALMAN